MMRALFLSQPARLAFMLVLGAAAWKGEPLSWPIGLVSMLALASWLDELANVIGPHNAN